jgi:hypothetical protein
MFRKFGVFGWLGIGIVAVSLASSDTRKAIAAAITPVVVNNTASSPVPVTFTANGASVQNTVKIDSGANAVRLDQQVLTEQEGQAGLGGSSAVVVLGSSLRTRLDLVSAQIKLPTGQPLEDVSFSLSGGPVNHHLTAVLVATNDNGYDVYLVSQQLAIPFQGEILLTVVRAPNLPGNGFIDFSFVGTLL